MIAAIHQPNLFPRLKVLQKLALANVWIVLDDVQFAQREYQNRALIVPNHGSGQAHWLTLPVTLPYGRSTRIIDASVDAGACLRRLESDLSHSFLATAEFRRTRHEIMQHLRQNGASFIELAIASTMALLRIAGAETRVIRSSSLHLPECSRSARLALLCQAVGAEAYVSGSGGSSYLELDAFQWGGTELLWQVWRPPHGRAAQEIGIHLRDGSALNLLARSRNEFCEAVAAYDYSRQRPCSAVS